MFLRATQFHPIKAAHQLLRHFHYKLELFGEQKLTKDITYDDLTPEDKACLRRGFTQFLETKDAKGRTVAIFFPNLSEFASWQNFVRVCVCICVMVPCAGIPTFSLIHLLSRFSRCDHNSFHPLKKKKLARFPNRKDSSLLVSSNGSH